MSGRLGVAGLGSRCSHYSRLIRPVWKAAWCCTLAVQCGCVHNSANFNHEQCAIQSAANALCKLVCRAQEYYVTMVCDAQGLHGWDCVFHVAMC